jgi:tripartite-type tricarboxylate transporter receptor subunit TctC
MPPWRRRPDRIDNVVHGADCFLARSVGIPDARNPDRRALRGRRGRRSHDAHLAQKMAEHFGKQVIIENRPGAGGLLAAKAVLDSSPDGYTLLEAGNGAAIGMSLFKNRPYNILQDFTSISMTASFDVLIATSIKSKYETLKDIVEAARKSPGKLNFGAINPGSTQNLSAHLFRQLTGIDVTIVPFRTTPELVTALLRNDIDVGFDYYAGFQSVIDDKKVRIAAVSGERRLGLLPNVPTARESGFPDFVVIGWNALAAPAGLPVDVLGILNREVNSALADPLDPGFFNHGSPSIYLLFHPRAHLLRRASPRGHP